MQLLLLTAFVLLIGMQLMVLGVLKPWGDDDDENVVADDENLTTTAKLMANAIATMLSGEEPCVCCTPDCQGE